MSMFSSKRCSSPLQCQVKEDARERTLFDFDVLLVPKMVWNIVAVEMVWLIGPSDYIAQNFDVILFLASSLGKTDPMELYHADPMRVEPVLKTTRRLRMEY